MVDLRSAWQAAAGQPPPRELVAARRGLTRAQRRTASRAVRRGEAADDPAVARLAVAQARMALRRRPGAPLVWFFAAMVALWAAVAVWALARGHVALALVFAVVTPYGLWTLWSIRPTAFTAARQAERGNRETLERAGCPYEEDLAAAEPVRLPVTATAAGVVALWLFDDLFYGAVVDLFDGRPLRLGHVVLRGAAFATLVAVANLTWVRRRTKRRSQQPIA